MIASHTHGLLDNPIGLWWAALTCTTAATLTLVGAWWGSVVHRLARTLLGVAAALVAASYWCDLAGWDATSMRRGAAFVLWPALAWTAWSGITYASKVRHAAERITEAATTARDDG